MIRFGDVLRMNRYDIIFIYRDALMIGSTFIEKRFAKSRAKMVLDFDDAIWQPKVSEANRRLAFLKNSSKTATIIGLSDMVFVGNQFLADYATQFNHNVAIIPSTIDTDSYLPPSARSTGPVCIGWTGSFSTIQHFETAIPALKEIKEKFGDAVRFKIIGDASYYCSELKTQGVSWRPDTEVQDLSDIDIGIMPLPDNEWTKGKCGMKGLQYMALGIPTLMSPVGVNTEIIQNGVNGYLPSSSQEWVIVLSNLIKDKELRSRIGKAGRQTVVDKYSVEVWKTKYLQLFNQLTTK